MNFKKTVAIAAAVGALAAISVPAMALENEFHGMYTFMGYQTNFFDGTTYSVANAKAVLRPDAKGGWFAEQRARVQYIAKANDNLKLVTHFELDSRFGGIASGYKGTTGNDSGNLDADMLTLETKSVYLDFNDPLTGANVKVGMQPWADSYQSLFLLADMTGVIATKKFGPATASLGWFRFDDNTQAAAASGPGKQTADLLVVEGKYAVNKDLTVGASYYNIQDDTVVVAAPATAVLFNTGVAAGVAVSAKATAFELLHMVGVNADLNVGPANIKPFAAFQFGDKSATESLKGYLLGAVTKTQVGPGAVNFSAMYMSGDSNSATKGKAFAVVDRNTTYFNAANMWLLVRNAGAVNSSTSVLGNDMTAGGRGLLGVFAGYEGTMGKVFYNANVGYAQTAQAQTATEKKALGTEINAQVGYKLYDNLSASAAVAYVKLGDALGSKTASDLIGSSTADASNPYAINLRLAYTF